VQEKTLKGAFFCENNVDQNFRFQMPKTVLNICMTQEKKDAYEKAMRGVLLTDSLLSAYRRKASAKKHGPKNGNGEIHGQFQRTIDELESRLVPILEWSQYRTAFDTQFVNTIVILRKCK